MYFSTYNVSHQHKVSIKYIRIMCRVSTKKGYTTAIIMQKLYNPTRSANTPRFSPTLNYVGEKTIKGEV